MTITASLTVNPVEDIYIDKQMKGLIMDTYTDINMNTKKSLKNLSQPVISFISSLYLHPLFLNQHFHYLLHFYHSLVMVHLQTKL